MQNAVARHRPNAPAPGTHGTAPSALHRSCARPAKRVPHRSGQLSLSPSAGGRPGGRGRAPTGRPRENARSGSAAGRHHAHHLPAPTPRSEWRPCHSRTRRPRPSASSAGATPRIDSPPTSSSSHRVFATTPPALSTRDDRLTGEQAVRVGMKSHRQRTARNTPVVLLVPTNAIQEHGPPARAVGPAASTGATGESCHAAFILATRAACMRPPGERGSRCQSPPSLRKRESRVEDRAAAFHAAGRLLPI